MRKEGIRATSGCILKSKEYALPFHSKADQWVSHPVTQRLEQYPINSGTDNWKKANL